MAKQQNDKAEAGADPRDATIAELEQSNGSLAARVQELQGEAASRAVDLAQRDAALAAAAADQRDAFQKERDDARRDRDEAEVERARLAREVDELRDALDHRAHASSPDADLRRTRVALETTALLAMHAAGKPAGVTHERWLSAAMLLADRTAADVEADHAPAPAARND